MLSTFQSRCWKRQELHPEVGSENLHVTLINLYIEAELVWKERLDQFLKAFFSKDIFFPPRICSILPRQNWAVIGRSEKGEPIGVDVYSHCVENFENLLQRYKGEGRVAMDCEKHEFS